jgi:SLOG cluster2/TIR domain
VHKPPLMVHAIFHPASHEARALARTIHKALNADPAVPGLRVPTVFCPTDGALPPERYDLDEAGRSLVVVLADAEVVDGDSGQERTWSRFIGDLWEACQGTPHRFFPVQLDAAAWGFDERLVGTNFVRAFAEPDPESRDALVVRRLVIELCRELRDWASLQEPSLRAKGPVSLFLSHTKLDMEVEPRVTSALIDYLKHDQPVRAWVDAGDIDAGSPFADAIEQGVEDSSLLCVLTDHYSTREWCRKEIILAKQHQRPVVVVAAFGRQEVRSFPYLGNVPVLRWPCIHPDKTEAEKAAINRAAAVAAVDLLLKETLRCLHATRLLEQSAQAGDRISARPPELLSLLRARGAKAVLYPDPPLGREELELLRETAVPTTTPLARLAAERPLQGTQIVLSMSESTDIQRFGLDDLHLREAMVEVSRYLLLKGATLVYGGHLGDAGYTQELFELVRAHHCLEGVDRVERIVITVGWPLPYNQKLVAEHGQVARLTRVARPADLDTCPGEAAADAVEADPYPADRTPESRYCWARGMTAMREAQVAKGSGIAARIILGGKLGPPERGPGAAENWYAGRIPGVLEEVVLSVRAGHPVFLIGAFGGAAALAVDLLEGKDRPEATWEYQRRAPHAEPMRALYDHCGQSWWDYPEMAALLRGAGPVGINPLLSESENRELFHTRHVSRMIELILKGLSNLGATS